MFIQLFPPFPLLAPSLTIINAEMATAAVSAPAPVPTTAAALKAESGPVKKAGQEAEQSFHRIRITLTSRNVKSLEKG